jgi:RNA recognition motif-containing protein
MSKNLFVAGLPHDFDDVDLKEMFELYGEVSSAKVILDRETGKSRGFGFVAMTDDNEAQQAIETLDGAGLKGKKMSVKEAETPSNSGGGGGFKPRDRRGPGNNDGDNNNFRRDRRRF